MRRSAAVAVTPINRPSGSSETERALLGALLLDFPTAWPLVADVVGTEHFLRADHRLIFAAIAELAATDIAPELVIVVDHLAAQGKLEEAGGQEYIADLVGESLSAVNARACALKVRDNAERERIVSVLTQGITKAREGSAEDAVNFLRSATSFIDTIGISRARPLPIVAAATWADKDPPPPRDWVLEGLIPAGRVTSLLGNGGLGKTLLAVQIGLHVSLSRRLFDIDVSGGPVLGIFCEDEQDELERRTRAAVAGEEIDLEAAERFYPLSRDGENSLLCTFERDEIKLTSFYHDLEATIADIRPRLVILDTAADLFAGDFISTPHVRQFLKIALGGLCVRHGCAILLLAHPSTSAINSGDGGGFSTAWNNSVRSRLYLRRPKGGDPEETQDKRVLEVRKANYAADGTSIPLLYQHGVFVPDPDPVDETEAESRPRKQRMTKVPLVLHDFMRGTSGVVPFGQLFDAAMRSGAIPSEASPAAARKQVQRALSHLCEAGVIRKCEMPRGTYRLVDNH